MNLLNNLTIKNLKLNKKRTIVTIIGIILSVALISAVTSLFFSTRASLIHFQVEKNGDYHYVYYNVPKEELAYFSENRSLEKIYYTENIGYADLKESKNEYKPYAYIKAFTKESLNNLGLVLTEGRYPENDSEIIIPTHLKTNGRIEYKVGDTITLEVGKRVSNDEELDQSNPYSEDNNEKIIDTTKKEYKIVGIIERPSNNIENYSAPGYTFITYLDLNKSNNIYNVYTRYNKKALKKAYIVTADILNIDRDVLKKFTGNTNEVASQEELIKFEEEMKKARYEYNSNDYLITLESGIISDSTVQALGLVVAIVCIIIIFTSVFCIKNSFDISITEKTKQYGMLSSIGATKKQIKRNVYYEAFILGLIGIPLGILLGLLASYILIIVSNYFLKDMVNSKLIFSFSFLSIIFASILGAITIYLSAKKSAHQASKIPPIQAIRSNNDIKIKSKKLKTPKIIQKIFGIGGTISYKNLKRSKKKYRTTVISIVICVSVFIALYYFINLAFDVVKLEYKTYDYNISVTCDTSIEANKNKCLEIINLDNISNYAITSRTNLVIENPNYNKNYSYKSAIDYYYNEDGEKIEIAPTEPILIYKIGDKAYKEYLKELNLSYEEAKDKLIMINYKKVDDYNSKTGKTETKIVPVFDIKKGDTLKGNIYINGEDVEKEFEVIALTQKEAFSINSEYITHAIVSDELYDTYINNNQDYTIINILSNNPNKLQDDIDILLADYDYSLVNVDESVKTTNSFYTLIAIFLYGFITVIALIGVTNIFNTITTNMELRKQEFAMLKSIGMTTKEFNHMIRLESIFYGSKSLLIGIPIGILLSYWLYTLLTDNLAMDYIIPLGAIIICIIAVFILITFIMKYSLSKINKQNTIETIRNENI